MATSVIFDNKKITEPGVYTSVKSAISNPARDAEFGSIAIIDTGSAAGYGQAGVAGELVSDATSIYSFEDLNSFRDFIRGGIWWDMAESLFRPNGFQSSGIKRLYWIAAKSSTKSALTLTLTNGGIVFRGPEGLGSNGVLASSNLSTGFAFKLSAGTTDTAKFVLSLYVGTYRGTHTDGTDLDGVAAASAVPQLLVKSPEVATIQELVTFFNQSFEFAQAGFKITSTTGALTNIVAGDLTTYAGYALFAGATETYSASHVDQALDAIAELDYEFLLADKFGSNATHANNVKLVAHVINDAKFRKHVVVGGGSLATEFSSQSIAAATTFNTERVIVVHGGPKKNVSLTGIVREYTSIYKAAYVLGRICGLRPQDPSTLKLINIDGEVHVMSKKQRELALEKGVLHTKYDSDLSGFLINEGINSLQKNNYVVNGDGTSHLISVTRILSALTKGIIVNAKIDLLGNQNVGPNYTTISPEVVEEWLKSYLQRQIGSLIISFRNISIQVVGDTYQISFAIVPNYEVNKLLFTTFLLAN